MNFVNQSWKRATIATDTVLAKNNAYRLDDDSIMHAGWTFRQLEDLISYIGSECEGHASSQSEIHQSPGKHDHHCNDGLHIGEAHLHLPAMIFGKNSLSISCNQKDNNISTDSPAFTISFEARDALVCWARQHYESETSTSNNESNNAFPLPLPPPPPPLSDASHNSTSISEKSEPLTATSSRKSSCSSSSQSVTIPRMITFKVPTAHKWLKKALEDESPSHPLTKVAYWDWTFNSDYCCTVTTHPLHPATTHSDPIKSIISGRNLTLSTRPSLSTAVSESSEFVGGSPRGASTASGENLASGGRDRGGGGRCWERCGHGSGIDTALLQRRDDILMYDELFLYQDDLEDCGEVSFDVKMRVMPECWFVLTRLFLRVDGMAVVTRESRIFHRFGASHIYMDIVWKQSGIWELEANPRYSPTLLRDPNTLSSLIREVPSLPDTPGELEGQEGKERGSSNFSEEMSYGVHKHYSMLI